MYFFFLLKITELSDLLLSSGRPEKEQFSRWIQQHPKKAFQIRSGSFRRTGWESGGSCNQFPLTIPLPPSQSLGSWWNQGTKQKVCFWAEKGASAFMPLSHGLSGVRLCQTWFSLLRKPTSLLDVSSLILLPMQNQTHRLILFVFLLRAQNPEVGVLLFCFLCFLLPFILFVPDLNRGLQRRVRNLLQEINTKRIRPPSGLLTLSFKSRYFPYPAPLF